MPPGPGRVLLLTFAWIFIAHASCVYASSSSVSRDSASDVSKVGEDRHPPLGRDVTDTGSPTGTIAPTVISVATPTQSVSSSVQATVSPAAFPRPFDSVLGENFTQPSCPNFFTTSFINNATFQLCVPFSLLLQNSKAFFQAGMNENTLVPLLDASCSVVFNSCKALMTDLANRIVSPSVCGNDYALGNPLVVRAYRGLLSYAPMYDAACLKADASGKTDGRTSQYCYVNAINSTSQADSQIYFLPLGADLPTGSSVSCSSCTQKTMAIFASAASNTSSPLNKDYIPAANIINNACGGGFVNASTAVLTASLSQKNNGNRVLPGWQYQLASIFCGLSLVLF